MAIEPSKNACPPLAYCTQCDTPSSCTSSAGDPVSEDVQVPTPSIANREQEPRPTHTRHSSCSTSTPVPPRRCAALLRHQVRAIEASMVAIAIEQSKASDHSRENKRTVGLPFKIAIGCYRSSATARVIVSQRTINPENAAQGRGAGEPADVDGSHAADGSSSIVSTRRR